MQLMDSGGTGHRAQVTVVLLVALKKTDRRFVSHEDPIRFVADKLVSIPRSFHEWEFNFRILKWRYVSTI